MSALIADLAGFGGDVAAVARECDLPVDAVRAATAYYAAHQAAIDARLAAHDAYFRG